MPICYWWTAGIFGDSDQYLNGVPATAWVVDKVYRYEMSRLNRE